MSILKNASIRTKILSLIVPLCIVGVSATVFLASRYKAADTAYSNFISTDNLASVEMARANRNLVATAYNAYRTLTYTAKDPGFGAAVKLYETSKSMLYEKLDFVKTNLPDRAPQVDALIGRIKEIVAITDASVLASQSGQMDQAKALMAKADGLVIPVTVDTVALNEDIIGAVNTKSDELTDQTNNTILTSFTIVGITFALGILAALLVAAKGITAPVIRLRDRMTSLAQGHTEASVEGQDRRDEVGQMAAAVSVFRDNAIERLRLEAEAETNRSMSERERMAREAQKADEAANVQFAVEQLGAGLDQLASGDVAYRIDTPFASHLDGLRANFNGSVANLQEALQDVGQNARAIDAGANEIRSAADDLSKRTEQQAASVEQTAAALEEITTTVKDSSRRAEEVGNLVSKAREGAEKSGAVVREAVIAMNEIERSSGEISNIIGVIDEIAFQTNLLALNAGVEAARAGEAGKGFAVVAQEVRELAQRSAKAAKEIKALITTSGEHVRSGVNLVGQTGQALEVIVTEVQAINGHIHAMVESAREQSVGLQEINTAVNTMDQGTQQNAAMVEQSTAASHSLAREAASLNMLLARFNVGGEAVSAKPAVRSVSASSRPAPSPARALGRKVANAFGGRASAAAESASWEEF
ncbi:methyl-accepting chemotaxis protein [Rhizobium tumorigenes]|uniref:Methyl-accepting chemotaxis protein n=1 Tax=Rhizobium tumorigenes TaxID=2041385 RepID=A0AAF1K8F6_9HYPH|nr:methyl-accepting chemotaxis protein [Rhizobium tumorigenes]WFR94277.1 methyl-accepting chemotaxis protein [Rhizobium tumorigenes]